MNEVDRCITAVGAALTDQSIIWVREDLNAEPAFSAAAARMILSRPGLASTVTVMFRAPHCRSNCARPSTINALMTAVCFNHDGTELAASTENHVVQLWDLRAIRRQLVALNLDWDMTPYPETEY
jgi:hypothetical protein